MNKTVRFYRPIIIEPSGAEAPAAAGFWSAVHHHLAGSSPADRRMPIKGAPWFGDAGVGRARAYPFIRCGRVRLPGDWPPVVNDAGDVIPLALVDGNLFETAYLVPFGTVERLAMVGPMRAVVARSSIEMWLGAMLGFPSQGRSLKLEPLLDEALVTKLADSVGVSKLLVTIPADAGFVPAQGPVSEVDRAILSSADLGSDLDRTLVFSYGNRRKGPLVERLLSAARRLRDSQGVSKIEATLMIPQEDGFRTEVHELLEDKIAISAIFNVDDELQPDAEDMLEGIHEAIQEYQRPGGASAARRS